MMSFSFLFSLPSTLPSPPLALTPTDFGREELHHHLPVAHRHAEADEPQIAVTEVRAGKQGGEETKTMIEGTMTLEIKIKTSQHKNLYNLLYYIHTKKKVNSLPPGNLLHTIYTHAFPAQYQPEFWLTFLHMGKHHQQKKP